VKVCLVTTGQPSTNPRLVKEADALVAAGFDVHVVAAYWTAWAIDADRRLLADKRWELTLVDWRKASSPALHAISRIRHAAARRAAAAGARPWVRFAEAALCRVGPELRAASLAWAADLYVAHNLGALPAARAAARARGVRHGFDAEDFHSGQFSSAEHALARFTRRVERRLLPECAYVTAASPLIAQAYRDLCGIELPTTILNVFPLRDRPAAPPSDHRSSRVRMYWFSQTIGPSRGLEDAVAAMALLGTDRVELHLRGAWQQGYEAELRRLAARIGVPDERIVWHPPADQPDMVRLAAAFDIGLALEPGTTINNDLAASNKIFTYVLAGTAVAATRTRGQMAFAPELGRSTTWCEPGNASSLAAALRPWIDDRDRLAAAREIAWGLGGSTFNWDREQRTFVDLVCRVIGEPAVSRARAGQRGEAAGYAV